MKRFFLVGLFFPTIVLAQSLLGVDVEPSPTNVRDSVRLTIAFTTSKQPWCGVNIAFGDGEVSEQRIESNHFMVRHTYRSVGTYTVRVEGKGMFRGLKSVSSCDGSAISATVVVVDPVVEKEKALAAERERAKREELEERERALRAREEELQNLERAEKERAARAKDAQRKKELEDRKKASKAREDQAAQKEVPQAKAGQPAAAEKTDAAKKKVPNPLEAF